jgi:hypothetical protein
MDKGSLALIAIVIAVCIGAGAFSFYDRSTIGEYTVPEVAITVRGVIDVVDTHSRKITLRKNDGAVLFVHYNDQAVVHDSLGLPVDSTSLIPNTEVSVIGVRRSSIDLAASTILITHDTHEDWPVQPDNVFENSLIPQSYAVTGMVKPEWMKPDQFFYVKVLDGNQKLINRAFAYPQQKITASTTLVGFKGWLWFEVPDTATGTIRFEQAHPATSTPVQYLEITIRFQQWKNQTTRL